MNQKSLIIHDISPVISESIAVFPGDTPYSMKTNMDFSQGHHLKLGEIHGSVHLGAHTDAPNHYHKDGVGIHERDLSLYFGDCQVIEVSLDKKKRIYPEDFSQEISSPRVLFKTNSYPNPNSWSDDFNSLSPELIKFLKSKNVVLVGIDTPSVDPSDSKGLESHTEIYHSDMAILEGIVLTDIEEGNYTLSAFPLKLKNADASPVRAVLMENK
tara:strand:- start:23211 stop:23849 length:639 start_codon:yes stop_codon:yes gene_type:complete